MINVSYEGVVLKYIQTNYLYREGFVTLPLPRRDRQGIFEQKPMCARRRLVYECSSSSGRGATEAHIFAQLVPCANEIYWCRYKPILVKFKDAYYSSFNMYKRLTRSRIRMEVVSPAYLGLGII